MLVAVRFLTGPRLFALGALLAVVELSGGNISLLLAGAMVVGFRYPAAWAFVHPDQGHAGHRPAVVRRPARMAPAGHRPRRDRRVVAISFIVMPGAWIEWVQVLVRHRRPRRDLGRRADPVHRPAAVRHRDRGLGRPDEPPLDGPGRRDARPAGAVVRRPEHAAGGHRAARAGCQDSAGCGAACLAPSPWRTRRPDPVAGSDSGRDRLAALAPAQRHDHHRPEPEDERADDERRRDAADRGHDRRRRPAPRSRRGTAAGRPGSASPTGAPAGPRSRAGRRSSPTPPPSDIPSRTAAAARTGMRPPTGMISRATAPPSSAAISTMRNPIRSPSAPPSGEIERPDQRRRPGDERDRRGKPGPDPDDPFDEDRDVRPGHLGREERQPEDGEDPADDRIGQDALDRAEREAHDRTLRDDGRVGPPATRTSRAGPCRSTAARRRRTPPTATSPAHRR